MNKSVAHGMPNQKGDLDEAEALASPLLDEAGFVHAFFTRRGGVSPPPWDTLNFAASTGDDPHRVQQNLERAAHRLGISPAKLYFLSQVHGTTSIVLTGCEDRTAVHHQTGDIVLTRAPGVGCGVRSADCAPILLADRNSGAVCAVHSGWRGTTQCAAAHGVNALRALVGQQADLVAAIGPHIEVCCFEVSDGVAAQLVACSSAGSSVMQRGSSGRPHIDLRSILRAQLEQAGLQPNLIDNVHGCTACNPDTFHSYRRAGKRSGRLLSAIVSRHIHPSGS